MVRTTTTSPWATTRTTTEPQSLAETRHEAGRRLPRRRRGAKKNEAADRVGPPPRPQRGAASATLTTPRRDGNGLEATTTNRGTTARDATTCRGDLNKVSSKEKRYAIQGLTISDGLFRVLMLIVAGDTPLRNTQYTETERGGRQRAGERAAGWAVSSTAEGIRSSVPVRTTAGGQGEGKGRRAGARRTRRDIRRGRACPTRRDGIENGAGRTR